MRYRISEGWLKTFWGRSETLAKIGPFSGLKDRFFVLVLFHFPDFSPHSNSPAMMTFCWGEYKHMFFVSIVKYVTNIRCCYCIGIHECGISRKCVNSILRDSVGGAGAGGDCGSSHLNRTVYSFYIFSIFLKPIIKSLKIIFSNDATLQDYFRNFNRLQWTLAYIRAKNLGNKQVLIVSDFKYNGRVCFGLVVGVFPSTSRLNRSDTLD